MTTEKINPGFLRGPGDDAGGLREPGYAQLHVDQTQLTELAGCRFGTNKQNISLQGFTGSGKSFLT